jgi:hypothetical protein
MKRTHQQQFIEKYLTSTLEGLDGGSFRSQVVGAGLLKYTFPCPFCSSLRKSERLRKKSDACFYPIKGNYQYLFICHNHGTFACFESIQFPEFLKRFDVSGSLLRRYTKMRNGWEDPDVTEFDFRPHF